LASSQQSEDSMSEWLLDDQENIAAMTVRQIIQGSQPILLVSHDADDGTWQFLPGGPVRMADGVLVRLQTLLRLDPSISELADLPLGWTAERSAVGQPWRRQPE
jgi:hypothetical protein